MATTSPDAAPKKESSYTYWVRKKTEHAAPDPIPRKLSTQDISETPQSTPLGSVWNQAGTWEEKCLTKWATERLEEILMSLQPLELKQGNARVTGISSCVGEATLVTVRNKKRYGYSYEITMNFKGEWGDCKDLEGTLKIPEASYNDIDDIQLEVSLSGSSIIEDSDKQAYLQAVKSFLPAIQEKMKTFEEELKTR